MKPVMIIIIAVVCSVVVMIGVLAVFVGINNIEAEKQNEKLQEYYADLDLAESYKIQYDEIWFNTCMNEPPASSYDKAERQAKKAGSILEYIAYMQFTLEDLDNGMDILSKKYPNSDYFKFELLTCPYEEEWAVVGKALKDYQRELTGELTVSETDKVTAFVSLQYQKCIEEVTSKFICDARLGEFTETAKLIYGFN
jgi:hypothetical protein